jgi:predicted GNAT family N-acyltransferase
MARIGDIKRSSPSRSELVTITYKEVEHESDEYRETVALRDRLLREPLGLKFEPAELDAEKDSHHLACYQDGELAACLVLTPEPGGKIMMRQLAVAERCQRKGIGTSLVAYAESVAVGLDYTEMVLHAREPAVPFYERLGYQKEGEAFIQATIPHFFMHKRLLESGQQPHEPGK